MATPPLKPEGYGTVQSPPRKYRKQRLTIEAVRYHGSDESYEACCAFAKGVHLDPSGDRRFIVPTLEGDMVCMPGDWLIKGIKGEFYPCKNDIFVASYEEEQTLEDLLTPGVLANPIAHILQFFTFKHLPDRLASVSSVFADTAMAMARTLPSNPETTVALRKLLEAKDAAVRAVISK